MQRDPCSILAAFRRPIALGFDITLEPGDLELINRHVAYNDRVTLVRFFPPTPDNDFSPPLPAQGH